LHREAWPGNLGGIVRYEGDLLRLVFDTAALRCHLSKLERICKIARKLYYSSVVILRNCLILLLFLVLAIPSVQAQTQSQSGQPVVRSVPAFKKPPGSTPAILRVKPLKKSLPSAPPQRTVVLPPLPLEMIEELKRQDATEIQRRLRIGIGRLLDEPVIVNSTNAPVPSWNVLSNGWHVWTLELTSQEALGLRLGLESVKLPAGARLLVYDPASENAEATPLTAESIVGQSQIWTETVFSQTVVLECDAPPEVDPSAISFSVTSVSHFYRSLLPPQPKSTGCEKDVACFPAWADQAAGVARIEFVDSGSAYLCTGCLLNDTVPSTTINYFLTANHCIGNQTVANTLETYWFYQASTCGGAAPDVNSVPHTGGGAAFLAGSDQSDFTLLRLHNAPPDGVTYLGWSTTQPAGETLSCIQHPQGNEKKISFGHKVAPDPNFPDFTAVRWSDGVTEEGSSGSPLLNAGHQVIGQLYGGTSACDNLSGIDIFGRFDISYPSMQPWIDPDSLATDLFPRAKGTYTGLFSTDTPALESAGFCTLTLTSKGTYTGSLQLAGKRLSFSGTFNLTDADANIQRSSSTPLSLHFTLDPAPGSDLLTGTITDGDWNASLSAHRAVFNSRTNPAPYAGSYTVIIPGIPGSEAAPQGYGFGTLKVDSSGKAKFVGSLADGMPVTQSVLISQEGDWPLYDSLYGGKGFLWAGLVIDTSQTSDDLHGDLSWIKKAQNAKFYPGGFTNGVTAIGSLYQKPNGGQIINMSDGSVSFSGGNLSSSFANSITLTADNKVVNDSDNKLTMSFALATGLFHGSVAPPDGSHDLSYRGVAFQKGNKAYGYFLGTDQSGSVVVSP
jgi:hypothetical protein